MRSPSTARKLAKKISTKKEKKEKKEKKQKKRKEMMIGEEKTKKSTKMIKTSTRMLRDSSVLSRLRSM